jgi:predicted enzyme involved in methoxymalonyl-ACP biosynthesis
MGRKLENVIMDEIEDYCTLKGINIMEAQYIATAKNTPVKNLYETLGYSVVADGSEIKKYTKNIQGKKNKKYSLYKKVFFKAE